MSPISSPLISVRRSSPYFVLNLEHVVADDRQDVRLVGQDAQVLGDLVEQLVVLVAELFLLQVDQLAERHPHDRVGLHGA